MLLVAVKSIEWLYLWICN